MKIKIGPFPTHRFYHIWLYNWFGYSPKQRTSIKIHNYDTWSMDHTLAPIVLPMLVQLKDTKHGAPMVDMKDVPKELRATKAQQKKYAKGGDVDLKHFERWDWILDEMIWAFKQKCRDDWWDLENFPGMEDYHRDYTLPEEVRLQLGSSERLEMGTLERADAHQERMSNGFRLFGKYFESLWD